MPDAADFRGTAAARVAWAGAVVFLLSLLWAAYAYAIRFDLRPSSRSAAAAVTWDVVLFSVFALHHSLLARTGAKRLVQTLAPPELERSLYTWVASLLFIGVCTWWQTVPGAIYHLENPWRVLGYCVQGTGLLLTIRSSAALDVLDLAGIRQIQRARTGRAPSHVGLETTGLYGFVRHPLYFAWTLAVLGTPDLTATRATFAVVSIAYLALAIPWEERSLLQTFGPDYREYQRRVRWRMMPGLY